MAITAEQRGSRRGMIGSSDAAAILGMDPRRSASDVWLEKTGRAEPFEGNDATRRGARLESVLIEFAAEHRNLNLQQDVMLTHPSGLVCANLDARSLETKELVEAKSTVIADEWKEEGTDKIPEHVIIQIHQQFGLAGPDWRVCWVPVLMPGYMTLDFKMYRVDRDDGLANNVINEGIRFMQEYVLPDVQPSDYKPSLEVLQRVRREPHKTVAVPDEVAAAWINVRALRLQTEKDEEIAKAALLAAMGDGDAASHVGGRITYLEQTARRLDQKKLGREYPKIAEECMGMLTSRVMRIEGEKKKKR